MILTIVRVVGTPGSFLSLVIAKAAEESRCVVSQVKEFGFVWKEM